MHESLRESISLTETSNNFRVTKRGGKSDCMRPKIKQFATLTTKMSFHLQRNSQCFGEYTLISLFARHTLAPRLANRAPFVVEKKHCDCLAKPKKKRLLLDTIWMKNLFRNVWSWVRIIECSRDLLEILLCGHSLRQNLKHYNNFNQEIASSRRLKEFICQIWKVSRKRQLVVRNSQWETFR